MSTEPDEGRQIGFEMGRLVEGFTAMRGAINRIEAKVDSQPTKADLEPLWTMARTASDEAKRANTRIDGFTPWLKIAIAVIGTLIVWGLVAIKSGGAP